MSPKYFCKINIGCIADRCSSYTLQNAIEGRSKDLRNRGAAKGSVFLSAA